MSLGSGLYSGDCDTADAAAIALASAVNELYDAGVLTVAGTGNDRSGTGMIAPACIAKAVSVGAVPNASNVGSQTFFGYTTRRPPPTRSLAGAIAARRPTSSRRGV